MSDSLNPVRQPPLHWSQIYLSVALTTLATLLLELSLTRIFSVVFFYHFAFLAISIALFGLGAGGVFSYVVAGWRGHLFSRLGWLSAINSLLVVLMLALVLAKDRTNLQLALVYFVAALPFFLAGTIVSLAISETIQRVDRVYFFDLMGAAAGCLVLVPLLNHLGGPNTVIAAAVLFAAAAAVWHSMASSVSGRATCLALALGLIAFLVYNTTHNLIDVKYAKQHKLESESFVKWNSFSRVGVTTHGCILIDADAATWIAGYNFDHLAARDRHDLLTAGPGLPYVLRPGAKTLIIGPGGGYDVARCLASGSKDVTGVEINPIIATTIMREKFLDWSQGIYLRPEVHIVVEDGRSFVRRSHEKYQVLQATLVDTWASTAAGAFALAENNLYTVDAFRDYLGHLTDDGLIAFTRWAFNPPRESLRLVSLAMEALTQTGEPEPWRHVIVARQGLIDTVLISRKPFSEADMARARSALAAANLLAVYLPGAVGHGRGFEFAELLRSPDALAYERRYPFDITPVTDNRPFFFYTVQPRDIWLFLTTGSNEAMDFYMNKAVPLLFRLMGISVVATLVILLLPPIVLGTRLPRQKGLLVFLLYFLFIGAGYILIEVALIQKFVLFLGHPTYALTVVIFSMLTSSGLGSYFSRRVLNQSEVRWVTALGTIAVLVALLGIIARSVLPIGVGLPLWLKIAITVLMISPAGFAMGMPFPTGLKRLEEWHKPSVRWAWALNAASSVLGSVGALLCAIYLGLIQTLFIGGLLYVAALVIVLRLGSRARVEQGSAPRQVIATQACD
jgi:spermidine synthase